MSSLYKLTFVGLVMTGLCMHPAFGDDFSACDEVNWKETILLQFDGIEEACQDVVIRDGDRYARFEIEFHHATADGDMHVRMKLQDGTRVERVFPAPPGFHILSNSGKSDFAIYELERGDVLDVFIPLSGIVAAAPTR